MKITALSAQRNDPNRLNVMVDGKFRFSLDIYQVADLGIRVGREYEAAELDNLETESQFGKVYARALEYCLMRPHSAREVRDYLYKKTFSKKYKNKKTGVLTDRPGVSKQITIRVFDRLVQKNYIDDEKFARYWVENRHQRKGTSMRKLRAELQAKGVDMNIINRQLAESDRHDSDELVKIIQKKRSKYPDEQKFMHYLARQGFAFDDIKSALAEDVGSSDS